MCMCGLWIKSQFKITLQTGKRKKVAIDVHKQREKKDPN